MTLDELRAQIDQIDLKLVELLNTRARYAQEIGRVKAASATPVYDKSRERVVHDNLRAANQGPLPDVELQHIFERIIDVMRTLQKQELATPRTAPVAVDGHQGPAAG